MCSVMVLESSSMTPVAPAASKKVMEVDDFRLGCRGGFLDLEDDITGASFRFPSEELPQAHGGDVFRKRVGISFGNHNDRTVGLDRLHAFEQARGDPGREGAFDFHNALLAVGQFDNQVRFRSGVRAVMAGGGAFGQLTENLLDAVSFP